MSEQRRLSINGNVTEDFEFGLIPVGAEGDSIMGVNLKLPVEYSARLFRAGTAINVAEVELNIPQGEWVGMYAFEPSFVSGFTHAIYFREPG